ncbi:MAG TPA: DUF389 domain-containing protein [Actinophytocola sp.]|uniref:DUF389 domain-containing protein n=1 Tax=Actinophytocola sp. TaxID=1872138 RepID=UPI002DBD7577|nr:DUF389 domain-containing protein [Actinophytocola sp.]HEU5472840.1 DUF389 domain-containing protein [Actinophytocola sp.]
MLHLRVISPAGSTEDVLSILRAAPGATHVVLLRDAGVQPSGDLVEADVAREAVDGLIAALCAVGVDHTGGITLEQIDTALSDAADVAGIRAPGDPADAVVWQELLAKTGEESRLNGTFLAFLAIACLLAAVGAITNSPITIVGAMVVGPEFGPLAAIAVGLVLRRGDLVRRGGLALAVGFPLAMTITAVATWLGHLVGLFDAAAVFGADHQIDFVYQVGWFSLIVALLAGAAGMLSLTSAKSAALVGVFISVTTVPAAGYAPLALIFGEWAKFLGSVTQLAVNLIGIVLAAVLVLLLRRGTWHAAEVKRPLPKG